MKIAEFRKRFFEELGLKTNWGKEQIKEKFDNVYFALSEEGI